MDGKRASQKKKKKIKDNGEPQTRLAFAFFELSGWFSIDNRGIVRYNYLILYKHCRGDELWR